ncbi:hydroxyisourate hydrolase [Oceanibium sediminis]|uniref:hydroxyisourate hydrolase n=1 Tax=Oceanibium sediminis TaxID=2026339 RepID=UPI0013001CEF|nr:hydroxyisourate hydrolase [Oceanibium sediminis]
MESKTIRFSIHILDGTTGEHAGGVPVELHRVGAHGGREFLSHCVTDTGGRAAVELPACTRLDVVIQSGARFAGNAPAAVTTQAVTLHVALPDGARGVHLPTVIAPNCSSLCWLEAGT